MRQMKKKLIVAIALGFLITSEPVRADEDDILSTATQTEQLQQFDQLSTLTSSIDDGLGDLVDDQLGDLVDDQLGGILDGQLGGILDGQLGGILGGNGSILDAITGIFEQQISSVSSKILGELQSAIGGILPDDLSGILSSKLEGAIGDMGIIDFEKLEDSLDENDKKDIKNAAKNGYNEIEWLEELKKQQTDAVAKQTTSDAGQKILKQKITDVQQIAKQSSEIQQSNQEASEQVGTLAESSAEASQAINDACQPDSMKITQNLFKCSIEQQKKFGEQNANIAQQNAELSAQFKANGEQLGNINSQLAVLNETLVQQQILQAKQLETSQQILDTVDGQLEMKKKEASRDGFALMDLVLRSNMWIGGAVQKEEKRDD